MKIVLARELGELAREWDSHLRKLGYCVRIAEDFRNARELAQRAHVIFLPAHSHGESGFLTCRKISLLPRPAHVVLVGPLELDLERFARFAGAAAYVPPGISLRDLTGLLTNLPVLA